MSLYRIPVRGVLIRTGLHGQRDVHHELDYGPNDHEKHHPDVNLRLRHEKRGADRSRREEAAQREEHDEAFTDAQQQARVDVEQAVVPDFVPEDGDNFVLGHQRQQRVEEADGPEPAKTHAKRVAVLAPRGTVDHVYARTDVAQVVRQRQELGAQRADVHTRGAEA
eukprot:CAMPEP_0198600914 /NCGR_PEP_ID=MMETSP1462-20131121/148843_1 /TAXON_ID=1333877 /ORGANISM="Brandtodinium nutriculum, Strain RCC3387" /LENGTH=165 /DNA_ID=CAMNT_0044332633 /DNA_START=74 /DNA_END=567 /DNA_ORIENTATION=-